MKDLEFLIIHFNEALENTSWRGREGKNKDFPTNNITGYVCITRDTPKKIKECYEFFKLFNTDDSLEGICKRTNEYAELKKMIKEGIMIKYRGSSKIVMNKPKN